MADVQAARWLLVTVSTAGAPASLRNASQIIEAFRSERATEYAEVLERVPSLLEELETERARGRTTYAEVEESEADLERFRSWLSKIAARDYFGAPNAAEAHAAVERCAAELAAFEQAALAAEAPDPTADAAAPAAAPVRRLRLAKADPP
jgi:hypothetical protein